VVVAGQAVEREGQHQLPPAVVAGQVALILCGVLQQPYWARVNQLLLEQGEQGGRLKPIPTQMDFWAVREGTLLLAHGLRLQKDLALRLLHQDLPFLGQPHLLAQCFWARAEALAVLGQRQELAALILPREVLAGVAAVA
jgi:hypothetical protein